MKEKRPVGIIVFSTLNIIVFGVFSLFSSLIFLVKTELLPFVRETLQRAQMADLLTEAGLKKMLFIQAVMAGIFLATGLGVFLKKEPARRYTVYFSFVLLLLSLVSVVIRPSLVAQSILNVVYPVLLIVYFTNRDVENWFRSRPAP